MLYQKLPALHDLLVVKPDVEVAADAVDVRLGSPICAGMLGIRMAEGDMNAWNFFVLQNVTNHVGAGSVGADGEFPNPIAVFIRAGVTTEIVQQISVFGAKIDNPVVLHLDR